MTTNQPTVRPTHSVPTVTFPTETRTVAATHDSLICFTEDERYGVDYGRMISDSERDFIVCPSWSDGREYLVVLARSESVTFAPRLDDNGDDVPGLTLTVRMPTTGQTETWSIDGYARVTLHR